MTPSLKGLALGTRAPVDGLATVPELLDGVHPVETHLGVREELSLQGPQRVRTVGHELNLFELVGAVPASNGLRFEPDEQLAVALERRIHPLVDRARPARVVTLQRADDAYRRHLGVLGLLPWTAPLLARATDRKSFG